MNKWEDSLKKDDCFCTNNQGLFIPNRQLSIVVAIMLFMIFGVFMTGYFLGKKSVVQQLTEKIQQEAFADQVYASIITQNHVPQASDACPVSVSSELICQNNNDTIEDTSLPLTTALAREAALVDNPACADNESEILQHITQYYAQLIGFGTEKSAQMFVKKLAEKGIETEIRKRTSKTAKGRTSYWYQVITLNYSNKDELIKLVNRITKEENIKDANIRVC